MANTTPHPRRIDWSNYAQAGPVRITDTRTGETRIEPALHPAEVKRVVSEGKFLNVPKQRKARRSKAHARRPAQASPGSGTS